tara:strand:- start:18891 stop:19250 length:360 start_codon:yes stop_codon:yes gene_type:complete
MGSKKEIAAIAAALTFIPAETLANAQEIQICDPDRAFTRCEKELYDAGIIWESRAEQARESFNGCMDKLAVRTSTVINKLVLPPPPQVADKFTKQDLLIYTSIGSVGFVLGALITALMR